jgi:hypothetical protein
MGTYAAPAFMMPNSAVTVVALFGSTTPDAIAWRHAARRQEPGERARPPIQSAYVSASPPVVDDARCGPATARCSRMR